MGERGERELLEAKKMKEDLSTNSECLQIQLTELREKEQQLAAVSPGMSGLVLGGVVFSTKLLSSILHGV